MNKKAQKSFFMNRFQQVFKPEKINLSLNFTTPACEQTVYHFEHSGQVTN